jgi:MFS transporter, PPP family, 3-phenylpropionic acid transporter
VVVPCASVEPGRAQRVRIALVFGAVFFVMGLHLPYWPVWLAGRGMSPEQIGVLLSLGPWMRVIANPVAGRHADRTGRPRRLGQRLALGVVIAYAAFCFAEGFAAMVVLSLLLGATFSPLIPLTDTIAMRAVGAQGGYGRVRRWGSGAFIAASVIGGAVLARGTEDHIVWCLIAASAVLALSMVLLPYGTGAAPPREHTQASMGPTEGSRSLRWFLLTSMLLHATHAMLYGFGTAHWRAAGIDEPTIGWLWAVGVIAEIGLFTAGAFVARSLSPARLLALAGLGGIVRWSVLASTSALVPLFAAQLLHALTFAALHLGALEFIARNVPDERAAHTTGLYSAASGVALGLGLPASGWLYGTWHGDGYLVMVGLSAVGLLAAIRLSRVCACQAR